VNLATIIDGHPGDAVALISRGRETTYGALREQSAGFRGGLADLGLQPGDRIGIACGNNWYFVASYLAALGAGLVAVPLNPLAPSPELQRALAVVGARALVVGPSAREGVAGIDRGRVPELAHLIAARGVELDGAIALDDVLGAPPRPTVERDPGDVAALLFTSGTVGPPRAAMLTHGNLQANLEQVQAHHRRRQLDTDVSFAVLPFFHIFGLNVALGLTLYTGSRMLLVERFDPMTAIESIGTHGVTVVGGAPTMWASWASLADVPEDAFSSVRLAVSGAAKLPIEVAETFEKRFGVRITEGYGLTEASPVVTAAEGEDQPFGSIGTPLPGLELRLVDDEGEDVLQGDAGEIWVRGPNVFAGYWEDPEATAVALTSDGFLRTGDVAVVDDEGWVYLVDRIKDLIIVSGFNVYPAEVEAVLREHPAVQDVAVVGVPHPHQGEAVKAFIVERPGVAVEEDEIISWCSGRLARYKCPSKILFVDELPTNLSGKVVRRHLR
jgi:long-chain acyl-CoA synthetase